MKKVVFIIDNLKGGGAEKAIKIIVEGLYEKGIDPILILLENKLDYSLNKNIKIFSLSKNITKYSFFLLYFKLLKLLKEINPDIIYATNTKSQILALFAKKFIESKLFINIQVDLTKQYENRKYIFKFFSLLLNNADAYSFISRGIYESLKDKIPKKEIIFISNPIDFKEIDKLKLEEIEKEYKSIFNKKVIINIGRLTKQKGQWILIEAFKDLDCDCNLLIIGTGEKEKELRDLIKKYSLENRVFLIGFHKNPFKFLYRSDIFVLSSLWEGFGNVIVEAMRCELPIISTDCKSGPREILAPNTGYKELKDIEIGEYGILVPVENSSKLTEAISLLYNNNDLQINFKNKSKIRANDFSKEKIVDLFIKKIVKNREKN